MSESISVEDLGNRIKQKVEEKQRLEEEIKQRRAILESTRAVLLTIVAYGSIGLFVRYF